MSALKSARRLRTALLVGLSLRSLAFAAPSAQAQAPAVDAKPTAAAASAADDDNPHVWKPKTRSVAVFKNGFGFFMREGNVRLRDGWCSTEQVPPATFGTLAIYALNEKQAVDVVGSGPGEVVEFDGRDAPKDANAKRKRLEAALKTNLQLHYLHNGQARNASGKLVSVGPDFVILESDGNAAAVPLAGISKMQTLDLPLRVHLQSDEKSQPVKAELGMAYLRQGITWIPEYTLKVLDKETAELTLRGSLINEAEDLIHTDVHLVVGVPHFAHTQHMAPLAVGQMIRTISASVGTTMMNGSNTLMNSNVQAQIMNRAAIVGNERASAATTTTTTDEQPAAEAGGDLGKTLAGLPKLESAAATDYTVYTKKDMTLRRGEKAIVTLFTVKIKYDHIYRWTPPEGMQHSLVLKNDTGDAWTTGPCLALSDDRPLSEDLLKYTPKGSYGELPVTAAINLAHDKSEREIARKLKDYSPSDRVNYDLVTLEGTLRLRNYEAHPVDVVIENPLPGKPLKADQDGTTEIDATKLRLLEREGKAKWRVALKPGEETKLTYQYERYVPSN